MTYLERIYEELRIHVFKMSKSQTPYRVGSKLVKESSQRKMWKLLKYAKRAEPGMKVETLYFVVVCGRRNRTPWKCKHLPYVSKAKRRPCGFATGGYVNSIEMDIEFPSGVAFVNRID